MWIGGPSLEREVNITSIDKHQLTDILIGTVRLLFISNQGQVILIINKTAYTGKQTTILFRVQMDAYYNNVNDQPIKLGGRQRIITPEGCVFPLSIINGLPYLKMRRYSQHEYDTLPHVILTSDQVWNPRSYDSAVDPEDLDFYMMNPANLHPLPNNEYDIMGEYIGNQAEEAMSYQDIKNLQIHLCIYTASSDPESPITTHDSEESPSTPSIEHKDEDST